MIDRQSFWRDVNDEVRAETAKIRNRRMRVAAIDPETGAVQLEDLDGETWLELAPALTPEPLGAGDEIIVAILPGAGDRKARGSRVVAGKLGRSTWVSVDPATVTNTTVHTHVDAPPPITWPAGWLAVTGRTLRVWGAGTWSAGGAAQLTIRVQLTEGANTYTLAGWTISPGGSSVTAGPFRFQTELTFLTPTSCRGIGVLTFNDGGGDASRLSEAGPVTVATDQPVAIRATLQWATASPANSATVTHGAIEAVA